MNRNLLGAFTAVIVAASTCASAEQSVSVRKVLQASTSATGATIEYPKDGSAVITSVEVTMQPGAKTGRHLHQVPVYVYVIQGRVAFENAGGKRTEIAAGQGFLEPVNTPHYAETVGAEPTRFLVVFMGTDKLKNIVDE